MYIVLMTEAPMTKQTNPNDQGASYHPPKYRQPQAKPSRNPNEPDAMEVRQMPTTEHPAGKVLAVTSKWLAPAAIATDFGLATKTPGGTQYTVVLPVVLITGNGRNYHAPGCVHAAAGKPVFLGTAQELRKAPCCYCQPHAERIVVAELREPQERNLSALYEI
jgi:hypothetical protein